MMREEIISTPLSTTDDITSTNTPTITTDSPEETLPDVSEHKNLGLLPTEDCGYLDNQDRIRNGQKTALNEFPWMGLVSYKSGKKVIKDNNAN